ncbi:MAG: glucosyltransferase domain-containing protein [Lachnospiraceae bacterium]|nr:glucosyltransferase domain-containing protein [Lachnospiraceae bacterium]
MVGPTEVMKSIKQKIKPQWKVAFFTTLIMGLLIHMPMMMRDIPNHDGLDSMHFDQNMITSGRWFLSVACGVSSYYTLPWLIGLLAIFYLALTGVVLVEFLEVRDTMAVVLISGLLVAFPTLSSTFAYVFTMDGYMLGLFLAIFGVWLTKRKRLGFVAGAVCLAFSLGIYQAYLAFAVLLCIYGILMIAMDAGDSKDKFWQSLHYLYMGIFGVTGYFVILQIMLKLQGKEMSSYHGGNTMGTMGLAQLLETVKKMYADFFAFTFKGNILVNNAFSLVVVVVLVLLVVVTLVQLVVEKKWWKSPWLYILLVLLAVGLPFASNIILLISPEVTYHALMRYQWVLFPIVMVAFLTKYGQLLPRNTVREWGILITAGVLIWNFVVTDQIAYSNLQKRYEKTYAYCVRLLDRIEQTEGYYQGIPIAMIGVVGDEPYPITDITQPVTSNLIGMNGDGLLYTGNNYELFMKHYLGATLNILPAEAMEEMYYSEAYREMESFPGKDSIRIIEGIMYIKTENQE